MLRDARHDACGEGGWGTAVSAMLKGGEMHHIRCTTNTHQTTRGVVPPEAEQSRGVGVVSTADNDVRVGAGQGREEASCLCKVRPKQSKCRRTDIRLKSIHHTPQTRVHASQAAARAPVCLVPPTLVAFQTGAESPVCLNSRHQQGLLPPPSSLPQDTLYPPNEPLLWRVDDLAYPDGTNGRRRNRDQQ